ncbi:MAG: hypothetical protein OXO48_01680 [Caldilineaceae bacterium]|nr:hypothetical protein [Caldilineaceae bacterium]
MSDKFESIGTIRYSVSNTSPNDHWIYFVPDSDHLLKYSEASYAVFVKIPLAAGGSTPPVSDDIGCAHIVRLRTNADTGISTRKSVPIKISNGDNLKKFLVVVLAAAKKQARVTVTVTANGDSLKLSGITFPSK